MRINREKPSDDDEPAEFVAKLFANAGVMPSDADRRAAVGEFGSAGNTADTAAKARALRPVAENADLAQKDFDSPLVLMQYFGYLRRDPNSGPDANFDGYHFWLTKLDTFKGNNQRAKMVKAFLILGEYRSRLPMVVSNCTFSAGASQGKVKANQG